MSKHIEKTITILGDGGVGKTSLVHALKTSQALPQDKIQKTAFLEVEDLFFEEFTIICYDLPGQDSSTHPINVLPDTIFKDTNLILLAFSLDRFNSLMNLETWLLQVRNYYNNNHIPIPVIMLLGTKADLRKRIDEKLIENIIVNVPEIADYVKVSAITLEGLEILKSKILYHLGLSLDQRAAPAEKFYKFRNIPVQDSIGANTLLQPNHIPEPVTPHIENGHANSSGVYESSIASSSPKLEIANIAQASNTGLHHSEQLDMLSTNSTVNKTVDKGFIVKTSKKLEDSSVTETTERTIVKNIDMLVPELPLNQTVSEPTANTNKALLVEDSGERTTSKIDDVKSQHQLSLEETKNNAEVKPNEHLSLTTQSEKFKELKTVSKEFFLVWDDTGFKYCTDKPSDKEITILFQITQSKIKLLFPPSVSNITKLIVQRQLDSILRLGYLLPDGSRIGRGFIVE